MATKGYHSYSGRGSRGKVALVVVLVVILLAACTYLLLQPYVVYEDDGSIRLELPFLEKKEEEGETPTDLPEVTEEDIDREEGTPAPPPKAELKALHAQELPYSCLNEDPKALMEGQSAVVVNLKRFDGSYTYRTELELPQGILQGNGDTSANLEKILAGKAYTTARVSALCDNAYAAAVPQAAIRYENGGWVDYYDRSWLDPKAPETKEYLCDLAKECARLGFDELLLDHFRYPVEGDMTGTTVKEKTDRVQAIHDLTAAIHEAAPGLNVSILLECTARYIISR